MKLTIALGGNAILQPGQDGTADEQFHNVLSTAEQIGQLVKDGHEVVITHGNGPQVGNILIQQDKARDSVPAMPLDVCGSQTQGFIGYMLQNSLYNVFAELGLDRNVATVVTQVLVDKEDSAFDNPTKPVGPFYDKAHAEKMMEEKNENWIEDSGRGWRKVVPSPIPESIIESPIINDLVRNGEIVIASGGGGIPVVKEENKIHGVEAVIDKDRAGCLLAEEIESDIFLVLTDVSNAYINYGQEDEEAIGEISIEDMQEHIEKGHFGEGSMKPKVQAAVDFVRNGGQKAIITSIEKVSEAVHGEAGTRITK
ncbi:MAG: carbamate kinase [Halanaerobiales bacterium]|nr:carbamate kinase [Halanaerobiales bacterium]